MFALFFPLSRALAATLALSVPAAVMAQVARAPAKPAPVAARPATAPRTATAPRPVAAPSALARNEFIRSMDLEHSKMDSDKNGQVSRAEIEQFQRGTALALAQQRNRALFAALDSDRNGQISPAEFARIPSGPPRVDASAMLRFDTNRDGSVSVVEHRAGTLANFDRLDSDKDGVVTAREMKPASGAGR